MKTTNKNILFIDDDSTTNYLHQFIITNQINYDDGDVDFCVNGKEAIEYLQDIIQKGLSKMLFPSIIFLDINMPELNGFGFLDEFKNLPKESTSNTKVVMVTSTLNDSDRKKGFTYKEVKYYIIKPVDKDKLSKILEELN